VLTPVVVYAKHVVGVVNGLFRIILEKLLLKFGQVAVEPRAITVVVVVHTQLEVLEEIMQSKPSKPNQDVNIQSVLEEVGRVVKVILVQQEWDVNHI
jgi:hypothetical protein